MPNCSSCGKYMQPTEVFRREMYVGTTRRVHYGKRISFGNSNHYRKQSVCVNCAKSIDEANERSRTRTKVFFLIVAIIIVLYFALK